MSEMAPTFLKDVNYELLSPMMKQYADMKKQIGDTLLFYRLGDFYELFFDDAAYVSKTLELTLTARDCGSNLRAPMCGVPHHAYETYASRLLALGHKIAICEQLEDPATCKGLVKRGIVEILTPGTVTDLMNLDDKKNNYLMSIYNIGSQYGIAVADVTTGDFEATELTGIINDEHLINLVGKYLPTEILYNDEFASTPTFGIIKKGFHTAFTRRDRADFSSEGPASSKSFSLIGADLFKDGALLVGAINAILLYVRETKSSDASYLNKVRCFSLSDKMELDLSTRNNLELTSTIRTKSKKGSLLHTIDRTKTAMGARLLRRFVEEPLISRREIELRLDSVEETKEKYIGRQEIIWALTGLYDIERISTKVSLGTVNPRELLTLRNSLGKLPHLIEALSQFSKGLYESIKNDMDPLKDIYELIDSSIDEDSPIVLKDGGFIKPGYSKECDELRLLSTSAKEYILQMEQDERLRLGIKNLKVGYNRVFGYYIDLPRSFKDSVPEDYHGVQTLTNSIRFTNPKLKELEQKILSAQTKKIALETELYMDIREKVKAASDRLYKTASAVALCDVLVSLGELASEEGFVRPDIDDSDVLLIEEGRHIVVESLLDSDESFIPNDTLFDDDKRLMVLTGPNMSGKSTYMRQVAIIVLLAQIGSFVPCKKCHIGLVDSIFTRIGSSDDISMGESTFMVEMKEMSYILKNATNRSLLLLDEVGRGTSTYDGLSIAWSIIEYLVEPGLINPRTIFATHYHELNSLEGNTPHVFNMHVAVKENEDGVLFLHKIKAGGTNNSYGIEVGRLAGLPEDILNRSQSILKELERIGSFKTLSDIKDEDAIFDPGAKDFKRVDEIREKLNSIDVSRLTPIEALNLLYNLTTLASGEK